MKDNYFILGGNNEVLYSLYINPKDYDIASSAFSKSALVSIEEAREEADKKGYRKKTREVL